MTNTLSYHLYVESKKYNKLVNITKKKQTHWYREQTMVTRGEREVGAIQEGEDYYRIIEKNGCETFESCKAL